MKTQTQTETEAETETETETKTGVHQQPQHALVAGARTFIWPWPMAQCLHPTQSPSPSPSGAGRRPTHASLHVRVHVHVHGHCPRGISRTHQFPTYALHCLLCSAQFSLSVLPWSALCLHVDSLRRCSDTEVAEFAQAGPRSRSIFMANWRQLALNFSSSFIVYAFTYAPFLAPPPPLPPLSPFLWHLARFLFKIHNCRRQRRVIVGEFATPCCLAASRLPPLSPFPLCTATPSAPPRNRSRFYTCSSYVLRYAALT